MENLLPFFTLTAWTELWIGYQTYIFVFTKATDRYSNKDYQNSSNFFNTPTWYWMVWVLGWCWLHWISGIGQMSCFRSEYRAPRTWIMPDECHFGGLCTHNRWKSESPTNLSQLLSAQGPLWWIYPLSWTLHWWMRPRLSMMKCHFPAEPTLLLLDGCCIYFESTGRIVESKSIWLKCWLSNKFSKKVLNSMEWINLAVVRIVLVLHSTLKMVRNNVIINKS